MKSTFLASIIAACLFFSVACDNNRVEPEETIIFEMPG